VGLNGFDFLIFLWRHCKTHIRIRYENGDPKIGPPFGDEIAILPGYLAGAALPVVMKVKLLTTLPAPAFCSAESSA